MGKVQEGLFSAHGMASAQALPPLIPVLFIDPEAQPKGFLADLDRAVRAPWRISVKGPAWAESSFFLAVESAGMLTGLRARALELAGGEAPGLFPAFEGFFLGCGEGSPAARSSLRPATPALAFTSGTIALLRIETPLGGAQWWREVYWETVEERPLRGRRES